MKELKASELSILSIQNYFVDYTSFPPPERVVAVSGEWDIKNYPPLSPQIEKVPR